MTEVRDTGVLICGHGSREPEAVREFTNLVGELVARLPQFRMESGFLEFAAPDISEGLEKLRLAGCRQILAIPGTLFSGGHARHDVPGILQTFAGQFPGIRLRYGRAFDIHPDVVGAACARVRQTLKEASPRAVRENTALVIVGRGATDPEVLVSMQSIAQLIQAELNLSSVSIAYAGLAKPSFAQALEKLTGTAQEYVAVLPYFLFTGKLVKRIYDEVDAAAIRYPEKHFLKCPCLNNHPSVIDGFIARIIETSQSGTEMHG
ncbi:MAG: sirohydrochlorin chelatase [Alphaproteobacteria bacterium]|nr:sirohydrochlorin chelatase [Alphaproteobacteria bacterium]